MSPMLNDLPPVRNWSARCATGFMAAALGGMAWAFAPIFDATSTAETDTAAYRHDAPIPYAPSLTARTLERAPLVQVRMLGCNDANCSGSLDPRIPCAMYAPGHKPKSLNEDMPIRGSSVNANFVVQNPAWKWPQPGGKGTSLTVTYSYANLLDGGMKGVTAAQLKAGVVESLKLWSAVTPLTFKEVADSGPLPSDSSYTPGSAPNLRFGHHAIDGALAVLAHAFFPFDVTGDGLSGDLHFDEGETWVVKPGGNKIDFIEVCVHELGHALGLGHSATQQAIMFPFYGSHFSGPGSAFIFPDDRDGIQAIYGPKPTNVPPTPPPPTPTPTPTPPSSVVTVTYDATNKLLTLNGDGSANKLTVTRSGTTLTLTAGTSTTFSNLGVKKTSLTFPNVSGKINVTGSLGSGSDSITCVSLDVNSFQMDLAGGNDSAVLNLCSVTSLNLNGGSGTDTYVGSTSTVTTNLSTGFP